MDVAVMTAAKVDQIHLARVAEDCGYSAFAVMDSQLIWSDPYACLALAADTTTSIGLGTIAVVGTRVAPVTAAAIATINRLAPGRTYLILATGHTAWRMMGHPPRRLAVLADTLRTVRGLLNGEQVDFEHDGRPGYARLEMADLGFVDISAPIPLQVAATGPRATALAGQLADGVVDPLASNPERVKETRAAVLAAAEARVAGLPAAGSPLVSAPSVAIVLDNGETASDPRVLAEAGPTVLLVLHEMYANLLAGHAAGGPSPRAAEPYLPAPVRAVWAAYCDLVDAIGPRARNLRLHAGHATYVHDDERQFVTPELAEMTCLIGPPGAVAERLVELGEAGLDRVYLGGASEFIESSVVRFAQQVLPRLEQ